MAASSQSTVQALKGLSGSDSQLAVLKDLKNAVIGNTWKKVDIADDSELLDTLLSLLSSGSAEIVSETTVIIGTLASVGALTLKPLLLASAPSRLLDLICALSGAASSPSTTKVLAPALRALRNVLQATTDMVWGHKWGVGVEGKLVGTGLVGNDVVSSKGKQVERLDYRSEASRVLGLVFEPDTLSALMYLIYIHPDSQTLLPLYQLLAGLTILPSHRLALAEWAPPSGKPFLLDHLLYTITAPTNPKVIEAALDLVGALVYGQPATAAVVRAFRLENDEDLLDYLLDLVQSGPTSVRVAAASCLTDVVKADRGPNKARSRAISQQLLEAIVKLLQNEYFHTKLCFVLSTLVSDDKKLQELGAEQGCPALLLQALNKLDAAEEAGTMGSDTSAKTREACILALASLAFQHDGTRTLIAEASPAFLPRLKAALSHPSYGVRAAACQLARALSRATAILRTSLIDSGVGQEVIATLRREVASWDTPPGTEEAPGSGMDGPLESLLDRGASGYTVEEAATAMICNLVVNFSPLRGALIRDGGIPMLVKLSLTPHEPLTINALWALKNMSYQASESDKAQIIQGLGLERIKRLMSRETPPGQRAQVLVVVQNTLSEMTIAEISRFVDNFGERPLLDLVEAAAKESDNEIFVPAILIISNLALGTDRLRSSLTSRLDLIETLSSALSRSSDDAKSAALRALRHLVESSSRTHRPRQAVVDLLQPYQLKSRLRDLAEGSGSIDVCTGANALLDVLDRAR